MMKIRWIIVKGLPVEDWARNKTTVKYFPLFFFGYGSEVRNVKKQTEKNQFKKINSVSTNGIRSS